MNDQTIEAESTTGTALIVIPASSLPTLAEADKSDIIGRLRAELAGYIPDASTEDGRAEIGTKARKVGVAKADFIRLAMGLKADHQATIKSINTELKLIEDDCDAIRDGILAPRTEYLNRQKSIVTANEAQITAMEALTDGLTDLSSADIKARYQSINSEFEWSPEFIQRASRVQNGVIAQLQVAHQAAKAREAVRAAEAVRQAEETEAARKATFISALDEIKRLGEVPPDATSHHIKRLIDVLAERDQGGLDWMEFGTEAIVLIAASATSLRHALEEAQDREAEVQRIHEAAIAAEATRLAEIEAEHRRQKDAEAAQALLAAAAERERLAEERAELLGMQAEVERVATHRRGLQYIKSMIADACSPFNDSNAIRHITKVMDGMAEMTRNWEEFHDQADVLITSGRAEIAERLAVVIQQEAHHAAKIEADRIEAERIRTEAAETMAAARLAQEQEIAAANLKAAMDAERQRVADEKAAEEQALADRMKRRKHVEKINDEAISSIVGLGFGHDAAKFIVESIARRSVAHVSIAY